ncbi:MAG: aminotransferase class I/II-fold pyridoxal phosphate-dependent enzyme [Cyanobacteria bacterium MAG IRC1_bin_28]|nr:aminotransferase class I/II-fold pyridoxal phosphate-dependent enzyme [Cyanobacteria bacterium MAG IRC1_bin_28]
MTQDPLAFARQALQRLPAALRRQERCFAPCGEGLRTDGAKGQTLLDFSSNDYLGLAQAAEDSNGPGGVAGGGAGASPLVTGLRPVHQQLREALCAWLGRERVFLFPSGFQANVSLMATLADRHCLVLADRLCHHSLLLGVRSSGAMMQRFAHNDLGDLEQRLGKARRHRPEGRLVVVSESLFSMEGTSPDVAGLAGLCNQFGALLVLDEAHALGVLGPMGRGLAWGRPHVHVVVGTFGKALGSGGAMVAVDGVLGDYLLQFCGGYRYSTALAPALAAATLANLQRLPGLEPERQALLDRARQLRQRLVAQGYPRPPGHGPVVPILVGDEAAALALQQRLEEAGLLVAAIRPPTVPRGAARLRVVLRRGQPPQAMDALVQTLLTRQNR